MSNINYIIKILNNIILKYKDLNNTKTILSLHQVISKDIYNIILIAYFDI